MDHLAHREHVVERRANLSRIRGMFCVAAAELTEHTVGKVAERPAIEHELAL